MSDSSGQTKIGALYSLFATDEGEYYSGGGEWNIDDFAEFMGRQITDALKTLLRENPNKMFSLVIDSSSTSITEESE